VKALAATLLFVLGCTKLEPPSPSPAPSAAASASASAAASASASAARRDDEPPARLENTCGELRAGAKGKIGRAFQQASLYGTGVAYTRDVYYGSIGKGSELELLDREPAIEEKYKLRWLKVRVVCIAEKKGEELQGRIGWVEMAKTSFSDTYDPRTGKIEQ
jgi:hypothetical protein